MALIGLIKAGLPKIPLLFDHVNRLSNTRAATRKHNTNQGAGQKNLEGGGQTYI